MERKNGVLEAQKVYDAGENRLQPKTYRLGMNFTFVVEVNDDANIIDITPLEGKND